jgi:hypothetical protein
MTDGSAEFGIFAWEPDDPEHAWFNNEYPFDADQLRKISADALQAAAHISMKTGKAMFCQRCGMMHYPNYPRHIDGTPV